MCVCVCVMSTKQNNCNYLFDKCIVNGIIGRYDYMYTFCCVIPTWHCKNAHSPSCTTCYIRSIHKSVPQAVPNKVYCI